MERPALQRLLADIEAGKVDVVVVYKVDRLTRSLTDFAKIVEVFDAHGVSFVSVTQQFNTTTSMGRLTLNVLLSFAQFEREVTGERIRDKIAASKKKGMWMGGYVAARLRREGSQAHRQRDGGRDRRPDLRAVSRDGIGPRPQGNARHRGHPEQAPSRSLRPRPVASRSRRGALYRLLQNALYRGQILHKGASYPGQHEAIVPESLWSDVQGTSPRTGSTGETASIRSNRVSWPACSTMRPATALVPTHANKRGRRYRYYVSQGLINGPTEEVRHGRRVPAADLESLIEARLIEFLKAQTELTFSAAVAVSANESAQLIQCAVVLATRWPTQPPAEKRGVLCEIVHRVDLHSATIEVHVQVEPLLRTLSRLRLPARANGPTRRRSAATF